MAFLRQRILGTGTESHRLSSVSKPGPFRRASGLHGILRARERQAREPSPATSSSQGRSWDVCARPVLRNGVLSGSGALWCRATSWTPRIWCAQPDHRLPWEHPAPRAQRVTERFLGASSRPRPAPPRRGFRAVACWAPLPGPAPTSWTRLVTVEGWERRRLAPGTAARHVRVAVEGFPEAAAPLPSLPAASKPPPSFRLAR